MFELMWIFLAVPLFGNLITNSVFAQLTLQSILNSLQLLTQWSSLLDRVGDQFESELSSSAPHELSEVLCGQLVRKRGQPRLKMSGNAVALN